MFKKSKLNIDKDICYAAKYKVKRIFNKKRPFFEKILSESIGKPKDLWEGIKIPKIA